MQPNDTRENYFHNRVKKLREQFDSKYGGSVQGDDDDTSNLFRGLTFFIDGYLGMSLESMRQLIVGHGGKIEPYHSKTRVDVIIASHLPNNKVSNLGTMPVVHPNWITECVKHKARLPYDTYAVHRHAGIDSTTFLAKPTSDRDIIDGKRKRKPPEDDDVEHVKGDADDDETANALAHMDDDEAAEYLDAGGDGKRIMKASEPGFVKSFFKNSRLHHLSAWKLEIQESIHSLIESSSSTCLVRQLNALPTLPPSFPRLLAHIDMDSFFVSVSLLNRPDLKNKPAGVSHSTGKARSGMSYADVASVNYAARAKGVRNGMPLGKALELCPDLSLLPYDFDAYHRVSMDEYRVFAKYTTVIEPVSCDEALLDLTNIVAAVLASSPRDDSSIIVKFSDRFVLCKDPDLEFSFDFERLQQAISVILTSLRDEVVTRTGCTCTAGVSGTVPMARLATAYAKPNGQAYLPPDVFENNLELSGKLLSMGVDRLHGIGWSRQALLAEHGVETLGDLRCTSINMLKSWLGKQVGEIVYDDCHGNGRSSLVTTRASRKTVEVDVNYGIRLTTKEEWYSFLKQLTEEVTERMYKIKLRGGHVTLKILRKMAGSGQARKHMGHGMVTSINKSEQLWRPIVGYDGPKPLNDQSVVLFNIIKKLFTSIGMEIFEVRGVGIKIDQLSRYRAPVLGNKQSDPIALPSPSQIEPETFDSLPADIQQEFIDLYEKRGKPLFRKTEPIAPKTSAPVTESSWPYSDDGHDRIVEFPGMPMSVVPVSHVIDYVKNAIGTSLPGSDVAAILSTYMAQLVLLDRLFDARILLVRLRNVITTLPVLKSEAMAWFKVYNVVLDAYVMTMDRNVSAGFVPDDAVARLLCN